MPETPEDAFRRNMQGVRARRGWSQRNLVDHLAEAGVDMDPATVARIESGARKGIGLDEAVAIAWVLGVNPARLFLPLDRSHVALTPTVQVHPDLARKWIQGREGAASETADGVLAHSLDVRYREEEDWRLLEMVEDGQYEARALGRLIESAEQVGDQEGADNARRERREVLDGISRDLYHLRRLGIDVDDLVGPDLRDELARLGWWDRDLEEERRVRAASAQRKAQDTED